MAACTSWTSVYVAGPLRDLCVFGGTSAGFPLMYRPPKLRVVPADVRLRVNHQFDVLHRSLGVVASPGFQSSLFDGLEGLCDHSRTSSSGTFDEFSSRFRSLPASSGLQDSLHQPPWSPGDSPSRASCSRPLSTLDGLDIRTTSGGLFGELSLVSGRLLTPVFRRVSYPESV